MNIMEKLAAEIKRVAELREQYAETGRLLGPRAVVGPAMMLMDHSLKNAIEANGSNDPLVVIAALRDLEGFTS